MQFDLPLKINDDFIETILQQHKEKIHSVFFTLASPFMNDARVIYEKPTYEKLVDALKKTPDDIKKYVTLNGRYNPPTHYSEENAGANARMILEMHDQGLLHGVIFLDFFYIKRLISMEPRIAELELVPSVNYFTDTIGKFHTMRRYLEDTCGSYTAKKVILDRSLNRDLAQMKKLVREIKAFDPNLKIEILVNEGCMLHCPFKINHDIFISMSNDHKAERRVHSNTDYDDFNLNKLYGCQKSNRENPANILRSPFIRPEDLHYVEPFADIIKLAGKTLGSGRMKTICHAYFQRRYNGNLLDLLDAMQIVSMDVYIPNNKLPQDFFATLSSCDKNCHSCGKCENEFSKHTEVFTDDYLKTPARSQAGP
jgi:hypothetical protein